MTLRTLILSTALLAAPQAIPGALADCVKTNGQIVCDRGGSGFTDSSGNVWLQDRRGRSGVILNLDGDDSPTPSKPRVTIIGPNRGDILE